MGSNNIIQFPGQKPEKKIKDPKKGLKAEKPVYKQILENRSFIALSILGFFLFTFNLTFNSHNGDGWVSNGNGRGVASVGPMTKKNLDSEFDFARRLASIDLDSSAAYDIGRHPSMDDEVRYDVLGGRAYILKRDIEGRNLVSIRLQSEENNPVHLLEPIEFLEKYGTWINKDFHHVTRGLEKEKVIGDRIINTFVITTQSGRRFEVTVERDLFQRLTSLAQTEVSDKVL